MLYFSSVEKDKYSLYLAITFGTKNIQDFSNDSFLRTARLKEIVYAAQRLETTCSLTSELIEFLRNFVLPEVDTDL